MNMIQIQQQNGAALIVSLVILVAMTLLGITSMKGSSTELIMAGNLRESALTFQAAEVGLRTAESELEQNGPPNNVFAEDQVDPDYLSKQIWDNKANFTEAKGSLANITINPRYIIKDLGEWNPDRNVSKLDPGFSGYGLASNAMKVAYFRVTARGFGQTAQTFRTVQSFFGRLQPNN